MTVAFLLHVDHSISPKTGYKREFWVCLVFVVVCFVFSYDLIKHLPCACCTHRENKPSGLDLIYVF